VLRITHHVNGMSSPRHLLVPSQQTQLCIRCKRPSTESTKMSRFASASFYSHENLIASQCQPPARHRSSTHRHDRSSHFDPARPSHRLVSPAQQQQPLHSGRRRSGCDTSMRVIAMILSGGPLEASKPFPRRIARIAILECRYGFKDF